MIPTLDPTKPKLVINPPPAIIMPDETYYDVLVLTGQTSQKWKTYYRTPELADANYIFRHLCNRQITARILKVMKIYKIVDKASLPKIDHTPPYRGVVLGIIP